MYVQVFLYIDICTHIHVHIDTHVCMEILDNRDTQIREKFQGSGIVAKLYKVILLKNYWYLFARYSY